MTDYTTPVDQTHRDAVGAVAVIRASFADAHAAVGRRADDFQAAVDALCARLPADNLDAASRLAHMDRA